MYGIYNMSRDFAIDPVSYVFDNPELASAIYSDEHVLYLSQFNNVALTILQERKVVFWRPFEPILKIGEKYFKIRHFSNLATLCCELWQ